MSWRDAPAEKQPERDRMPYVQISADMWVVMREHKDRPKAVIERVKWRDGSEQFLLKTWHSDPAQRRLVSIHESVEEANRRVKWPSGPVKAASAERSGPPFDGHPTPPRRPSGGVPSTTATG